MNLRFAGRKIVVDQLLKACEQVTIHLFTGDELTVVESEAIVEKQFDCGCDNGIAVPVAPIIDFVVNFPEAVYYSVALAFRQMHEIHRYGSRNRVYAAERKLFCSH